MNNHKQKINEDYQAGKVAYERKDYRTACKILYPLAVQGSANAQHLIGVMYAKDQDFSEAVKWYKKSAKQGYVHSQYDLAMSYRKGLGIPQNHGEAVRWLKKAAEQKHIHARHELGMSYYNLRNGEKR
ncbi:MAG: tetratricopeptide repeat protein [Gemmatimonadota bacterium]|nr:tetratricopeptide repeat protein [Gemmatimonadota bacterium]